MEAVIKKKIVANFGKSATTMLAMIYVLFRYPPPRLLTVLPLCGIKPSIWRDKNTCPVPSSDNMAKR